MDRPREARLGSAGPGRTVRASAVRYDARTGGTSVRRAVRRSDRWYERPPCGTGLIPRRGGAAWAARGSFRAPEARSAPRRVGIGGTRLAPRTRGSFRAAEGRHRRYEARSAPRRVGIGGTRLAPRTRGSFRVAEGRHRRYEARPAHATLAPRRGGSASAVRGSFRVREARSAPPRGRTGGTRLASAATRAALPVGGSYCRYDARTAGTTLGPRFCRSSQDLEASAATCRLGSAHARLVPTSIPPNRARQAARPTSTRPELAAGRRERRRP